MGKALAGTDRLSRLPARGADAVPLCFNRPDYFFLEEVINSTQAAKRKLHKSTGSANGHTTGEGHAKRRQRKRGWGALCGGP